MYLVNSLNENEWIWSKNKLLIKILNKGISVYHKLIM